MSETKYTIKPLTWKLDDYGDPAAETISGVYRVNLTRYPPTYVTCDGVSWWMRTCRDIAHGKELAEQHYRSRLLAALEPAEGTK